MDADHGSPIEPSRQGEGLTEASILPGTRNQNTLTGNLPSKLFTEAKPTHLD